MVRAELIYFQQEGLHRFPAVKHDVSSGTVTYESTTSVHLLYEFVRLHKHWRFQRIPPIAKLSLALVRGRILVGRQHEVVSARTPSDFYWYLL